MADRPILTAAQHRPPRSVRAQEFAESNQRAVAQDLRGVLAAPQAGADLGERQVFEMPEFDHSPVIIGQLRHGVDQSVDLFALFGEVAA